MLQSAQAAVVFAALIVPGFGLLRGYYAQRAHSPPARDLYLFAQAVVVSLAWLMASWWPLGHTLVGWTIERSLKDHEFLAWLYTGLLLGLPYLLGRGFGELVARASTRDEGRQRAVFERLGLLEAPTAWEVAWAQASLGRALVGVHLKDGTVVEGQFASESRVDLSPKTPKLFLERSYRVLEDGSEQIDSGGVFIDGSEIAAVRFYLVEEAT